MEDGDSNRVLCTVLVAITDQLEGIFVFNDDPVLLGEGVEQKICHL